MRYGLIISATAVALSLSASAVLAQNTGYYRDGVVSHPYGTTHSLNTGGYQDDDYSATASPQDYAAPADQPVAQPAPQVRRAPAAPDFSPVQKEPEYFNHAQGSMGTP